MVREPRLRALDRGASCRRRRGSAWRRHKRRDGRKFGRDQNQRMGKRRVGHLLSARCQRLPAAKSLRRSGRGGRRLRLRRRRVKLNFETQPAALGGGLCWVRALNSSWKRADRQTTGDSNESESPVVGCQPSIACQRAATWFSRL